MAKKYSVAEKGKVVATREVDGKTLGWAKMRGKRGNVRDTEVTLSSKKKQMVLRQRKKSSGGAGG